MVLVTFFMCFAGFDLCFVNLKTNAMTCDYKAFSSRGKLFIAENANRLQCDDFVETKIVPKDKSK